MEPILEELRKQPNNKRGKKRIALYFYMVLILLLLSTVASYTWFSLTRRPTVSQMALYIAAHSGLEFSKEFEGGEWSNQLAYPDLVSETTPLRPVTWSEKNQSFFAATYGIDGRITDRWWPLSDERNANRDDYDGYYCIASFYARAGDDVTVFLAEAAEPTAGVNGVGTYLVGKPQWSESEVRHLNIGRGAENAMRVGIEITPLDESGRRLEETQLFYIYEPNCDTHIDGSIGYVVTPSIDGEESLVPAERLLPQTVSSWVETDPVERGVQFYTYGKFTAPVELFAMKTGEKVQIRLYFWLEGQDVDCTNALIESQILANIQFVSVGEGGSGLVPVS
ncbi:MAG: hypothetical protein IJC93_04880 [Clostridia bacterium]|nr:hypothetical protein [Clostridia bacterium]